MPSNYSDFSRSQLLDVVSSLEAKLGVQRKRNELLNIELKRLERRTNAELEILRKAVRTRKRDIGKGVHESELKKENSILKATIQTYYEELKRYKRTEVPSPGVEWPLGENDNPNGYMPAPPKPNSRKKEKQQQMTTEEKTRKRMFMLANRAARRKNKEKEASSEWRTAQVEQIAASKAKKARALAKFRKQEAEAYRKKRADLIVKLDKLSHHDMAEDADLRSQLWVPEASLPRSSGRHDSAKMTVSRNLKAMNDGTVDLDSVLARLDGSLDDELSD